MNKRIKVLYEISNLGLGNYQQHTKTGIFRAIYNTLEKIQDVGEMEIYFTSCVSLYEAVLTEIYLKSNGINWKVKNLELWHLVFRRIYLGTLKSIHSSKSNRVTSKIIRKIKSIFLNILSNVTIRKKVNKSFDIYHSCFFPFPNLNEFNIRANHKIITIYDLIPVLMPNYFVREMQTLFQKILSRIDIHKDWVICISHSTKKDFCKLTGMPEERVFVTHLGASNNFYKESNTNKIQETLDKYNIPQGRYILGLSTLEPRKNTAHLIRCFFKILLENKYDDVYLVLAGSKGWLYEEIFQTADSHSSLKDKVIFTGFIDDKDLSSIYSGASFFVYPSLYEGFGLPPLEAMQCGLPVITSNNSSLPEVVGDAGIMVNATDESQLCQAMTKLLNDPNLCQQLSKQALQQSQNFSWEKCAAETIAIYQHILEK
jgi:glycosyltransferase involved in cell wall biosynthesis